MSVRDDLERVGAEAICARRGHTGPFRKCPTSQMDARAVLDALLASRDPDGNRMVILASELRHVGTLGVDAGGEDEFMSTTEPIINTVGRKPDGEWIYEPWGRARFRVPSILRGGDMSWLEEAEARAEKATPGPWWTEATIDGRHGEYVYGMAADGRPNGEGIITASYYGRQQSPENAEFIAAARTDLPFALALIRQLGEALVSTEGMFMRLTEQPFHANSIEGNALIAFRDATGEGS